MGREGVIIFWDNKEGRKDIKYKISDNPKGAKQNSFHEMGI